ncbi:MAG: response regulator [Lachnospiraceae bacterium]|nr:response regulator [Lachnospiraceae bacterium]
MNKKKENIIKKIQYFIFSEDADQDVRNLAFCTGFGITACIYFIILNLIIKRPLFVNIPYGAFLLICICMVYLGIVYKEYKKLVHSFSVAVNIIIFPLFFLMSGDIYSYSMLYLVMGFILIFYLVDPPALYFHVLITAVWDLFIIIFVYNNPELFQYYREISSNNIIIYSNFFVGAFILIFVLTYQSIIHSNVLKNIREADDIIRKTDLSKSKFLANMTFEIKTPMNAIINMNELLLKEELSPEEKEEAENIKEASNQLSRIVNDALIYSRLDAGSWKLENSAYSFYDLISDSLDNFRMVALVSNIDVYAYIDANIPKTLYGDEASIKHIFTFLLENSLQHDVRYRVSIDIRCEYLSEKNSVRLECSISEAGNGLTDEEIESLLGAYKRLDSRMDSDLKGMGLEISICEELLHLMGGSLKIESVKGVGISIRFSFENYILNELPMVTVKTEPIKRVLVYLHSKEDTNVWKPLFDNISISPDYVLSPLTFKDSVASRKYTHIFIRIKDYVKIKELIYENHLEDITYVIIEHKRKNDNLNTFNAVLSPMNSITVSEILNGSYVRNDHRLEGSRKKAVFKDTKALVVDDSLINLKLISAIFDNFKISTDTVVSGEKCLEYLKNKDYDIVFLDHRMPGMDGLSTLKHIKESEGDKSLIPVIGISSEIGRDIRKELINEGFSDYISKPVKSLALENILVKYLPKEKVIFEDPYYAPENGGKSGIEGAKEPPQYDLSADPLIFDINLGLENIGGDKEIYDQILLTYYCEGIEKIDRIEEMSKEGDLQLFTTTVHALKSSSASVGATGISSHFKQFEMAGKDGSRDFIEKNLTDVILNFKDLLMTVNHYLQENGLLETESEDTSRKDEEKLDISSLEELYAFMDRFDLKNAEKLLNSIAEHNYSHEVNKAVRAIKNDFDTFEYFKAKDKTKELLELIK